ncbi:MAG: hypothetical protein AB2705_06500 [Candidatus Thiodiazotropha sp.]
MLCGDQKYHIHLRQLLLLYMCTHSVLLGSLLVSNVTMNNYINQSRMSDNKVWATQVEIVSMAHFLKTDIYTYAKYGANSNG